MYACTKITHARKKSFSPRKNPVDYGNTKITHHDTKNARLFSVEDGHSKEEEGIMTAVLLRPVTAPLETQTTVLKQQAFSDANEP